ncbi:hypothetical protein BD413DRAFT_612463 [Trametes elegans]|nr:hypothetical protein BD413DRAFT_612463 [Trametes elegans]
MKPRAKKAAAYRRQEDTAFLQMVPAGALAVDVLFIDRECPGGYTFRTVTFRKGDDVILNSESCDGTDDVWVGRISQIRTSQDRKETLVKIRWYWSRNDIAKHIKTFDISQCAPLERVLSDDYDYVSPYTLSEVIRVHRYNEHTLDPPTLSPDDFFVRTTLLRSRKLLKPALGSGTCFCEQAYNPFPPTNALPAMLSLSVTRDVMHFCPNPNCRRWHHTSCLTVTSNLHDALPLVTRGLRLLAVNPDEEVLYAAFAYFYEAESQDEICDTDGVSVHRALDLLGRSPDILAHLPESLLRIAQMPIVRCAGAPFGLAVGNVADVVLARRLVYAAVQHGGLPERDPRFFGLLMREQVRDSARVGTRLACGLMSPAEEEEEVAHLEALCDELAGFETLALPYNPYWDRREEVYKAMGWMFEGLPFVCPQCRGAI